MWPVRGRRELLTFFVLLVVLLPLTRVATDQFGDRTIFAACVAIGGVGGAWLWYRRGAT